MRPFTTLTAIAAPLIRDNIDTDAIIPSREIKSTGKTGLAKGLFAAWRADPDFVLDRPEYLGARILIGGANFGCGSSREHAVWALGEAGFRVVIAPSFAPIFAGNCVRNGIVPVALNAVTEIAGANPVTIDLPAQTVSLRDGRNWRFAIGAEDKAMLREGLDAIDLTFKHRDAIAAWTVRDRAERPWIYFPPRLAGEGDHSAKPNGGGVDRRKLKKSNETVIRARSLRRSMSAPEIKLWQELRKRPEGLKFRRQHPAGPYILDFYCAQAKLCVEVDSEAHNCGDRPARDAERDDYLKVHGVKTVRLLATTVMERLNDAVDHVVARARARIPLHHSAMPNGPPPQQAGEER